MDDKKDLKSGLTDEELSKATGGDYSFGVFGTFNAAQVADNAVNEATEDN